MAIQVKTVTGLTGNQLKILALLAMTCDHVGLQLLPQYPLLRIIGRLALPIFAYMIAQGCRYTRNRGKYLLSIAAVALLCQVVYFVAMGSLYQCIMVTFSLSVILIFALDHAMKTRSAAAWAMAAGALLAAVFLSVVLPDLLPGFAIDYGIWGIVLPVLIFFGRDRLSALALTALGLLLLCLQSGGIQWYSLAALPLLALYNGTRGKTPMKYLFYIYYPAHLAVIYLLSLVL